MITLEETKEQLLSQIELELCRIFVAGSNAPNKLKELYDHVSELHFSNPIFIWYKFIGGNVHFKYLNDEIRICMADPEDGAANTCCKYFSQGLDSLIN